MNPSISPTAYFQQLFDAQAQAAQPLHAARIVVALVLTFALSLAIATAYRHTHRQVVERGGPPLAMVLVSMVTTLVVLPISSNILLSLGMVGALSIVRFRTAMKDPADIAFLFWAIGIGVCNGAGFYNVSVIGTAVIFVLLLVLGRIPVRQHDPVLLVVRYHPDSEAAVSGKLPAGRLMSKLVQRDRVELTLELRQDLPSSTSEDLRKTDGVADVALVRYDGSYLTP
jgi:hypothetical protein